MAKVKTQRIIYLVSGGLLLIAGITLVLAWWPQVVDLFKGVLGMVLALAGLLVLYLIKE